MSILDKLKLGFALIIIGFLAFNITFGIAIYEATLQHMGKTAMIPCWITISSGVMSCVFTMVGMKISDDAEKEYFKRRQLQAVIGGKVNE